MCYVLSTTYVPHTYALCLISLLVTLSATQTIHVAAIAKKDNVSILHMNHLVASLNKLSAEVLVFK